ncbi:uncharacterized protein LOC110832828 isoform X1 [Zootermopsis nevadensis]|nr:uncharacterized protein LOC110832828 isoform X1 [Zootermopsis nevadensis]
MASAKKPSIIAEIDNNTRKELHDEFNVLILQLWTENYEGLVLSKYEDSDYYTTPQIEENKASGIDLDYLKKFPVAKLLREKPTYISAVTFLRYIFVLSAARAPTKIAVSLMGVMKSKLNSMRIMNNQAIYAKDALNVACGSVSNDYKRLTNKSEEFNLDDIFEKFSSLDKAEIGIELIRNGLWYKKEYKGKRMTLNCTSGVSISIYFPTRDDDKGNVAFTHGRVAVATARETAAILMDKDDVPALGLNIGWQAMATESSVNKVNRVLIEHKLQGIEKSFMYMVCIPKVKPHSVLGLKKGEAHIMMIFHIMNDSYNSLKRRDNKIEASFTSGIFSKLENLGIEVQVTIIKALLSVVIPICLKNMRHKGEGSKEVVSVIKSVMRSMVQWNQMEESTAMAVDMSELVIGG